MANMKNLLTHLIITVKRRVLLACHPTDLEGVTIWCFSMQCERAIVMGQYDNTVFIDLINYELNVRTREVLSSQVQPISQRNLKGFIDGARCFTV